MPKERKLTRKDVDRMSDQELKEYLVQHLERYGEDSLVHELVEETQIFSDIMRASQNKRTRPYVQKVIGTEFENVFDDEDNMCLKAIRNIQCMIVSDNVEFREHEPVLVRDKCNKKERKIIKPDFADEQIIHHAIIRVIMPQLRQGMYKYTCASIPGRGIHYVRKHVLRAIANDPKNTKYVLKMDIRKFFDSIPHRILKKSLKRIVKDPDIRKILFKIIDTTEKGLPLGFFTSQWIANFFLQPLDHYIKERILIDCGCNVERTGRYGAVYYYRYMDDMVIFGPSKKELHKMRIRIEEVLNTEFGLNMKYDWQVFRFDYIDKKTGERKGRPLDFVGFQFYHDHTTIRKRTYKKIMKLIHKLQKLEVEEITFHDAASMLSYYGFIYWSDAKGLYNNFLKPYIKLKDLKNIVRKEYARIEHMDDLEN